MGTLFQKALYIKKYFSIGNFVAVCLCLLKKHPGKMTAKMLTFSHGLELKTKKFKSQHRNIESQYL